MTGPPGDAVTFSVVTISYQDEDGLRRTIASTAEQDYTHVEHIVVDGGSGARVEDMLQHSGVGRWRSEPDGGRYPAMNIGSALASGDVVWFLHSSDTFSHPGVLSEIASALGSVARARSCWGFGSARLIPPHSGHDVWRTTSFDRTAFALGTRPIPHQASFFGRDVLASVGSYDEQFGIAADQLLMLAASLHTPPLVVDDVVCDFDTTGAGTVRGLHEHYADVRRMWDTVEWYPIGGRRASRLVSRIVEARARVGLAARSAITANRASLSRSSPPRTASEI
ncbi:glycosyltransferase [Rhodococcus sp. SORGH_AS_0301]|uniref:glycosyltransferase n=1 Tax=Rhodococcus sp. SORGH_AS_0301 TaxID=3041780 RepID=UPI002782032C|nr:glycosyltransferase [Rhodococcus sp. SORGH_AS_0301]MDQ1181967.1 glycosyltransferase involved in cell wall biosynthesis [Rhodococcus sp. SORGH_AS_0301]